MGLYRLYTKDGSTSKTGVYTKDGSTPKTGASPFNGQFFRQSCGPISPNLKEKRSRL